MQISKMPVISVVFISIYGMVSELFQQAFRSSRVILKNNHYEVKSEDSASLIRG